MRCNNRDGCYSRGVSSILFNPGAVANAQGSLDSQSLKALIPSIHRWSKRWAKRSFPSWNITNEAVGFTSEYRVFGRMLHTAGHQVSGDRVCSVWWSLTMVTAKEAIGKRREIFLSKANFLHFDVCEKGRGLIISLVLRYARFWIKK